MFTIEAQYYGYVLSEFKNRRLNGRYRWMDFAAAANTVAKWSQWRECRVDPVLSQLATDGCDVVSEYGADHPAEYLRDGSHYFQPGRHFQLTAAMVHQLSQLIFISDLRFHEYDTLFYRRPDFKRPFIDPYISLAPLRTTLWPSNPYVPPFLVTDNEMVYSPVEFLGLQSMDMYMLSEHPFRMTILDNFADIGGWPAMKPRLYVEPSCPV